MWADERANVHVNPAQGSERLQWSPPAEVGIDYVDVEQGLPRLVAGRKQWVALIATPFRLTDEALDVLGTDNKILKFVTSVDLADKKLLELEYVDVAGNRVPSIDFFTIPVLSFFDVARNLSLDIQRSRSFRQQLMGQDGEFHTASKEDKQLADKYVFSRSLLGVAENPALKDEVDDDFADGKLDELRDFVKSHGQRLVRPDFLADAIGAELVAWLRRDVADVLMDGCLPEDGGRLLLFLDEITAGLSQTGAGLAYLGSLGRTHHAKLFMGRVFDDSKPLDPKTIKLANRGIKHFAKIFTAVWVAKLIHIDSDIKTVLFGLESVLGPLAPRWHADFKVMNGVAEVFALRPKVGSGRSAASRHHVELKALVASRGSLSKLGTAIGYADFGFKLIDSLNVALALRAYFETEITQEALRSKNAVAAAAYSGDLLVSLLNKGFDIAGRETVAASARAAVRLGGLVVAAYTMYSGFVLAADAYKRGDYDAMVAMAVAVTLTVSGSLIAYFCASAAVGVVCGPVGWVLAALGGVAYIIYLYLVDSEMETFVSYCAYGESARGEEEYHVPWCPVPLGKLAESWSRQSQVLGLIQRQFALGFGHRASVGSHSITPFYKARLYTGYVDAGTKFDVVWRWKAVHGSGDHREAFGVGGDPAATDEVDVTDLLVVDRNGEMYIDVNIPTSAWRDSGYSAVGQAYGFEDLTISVQKSYVSPSGTERIPPGGPIMLTIQRGSVESNVETRVLSVLSA